MWFRSLAWFSGLKIQCCCGVGLGCGLDPELLWLWHRPAAAAAIQPLAWEFPYAPGAALKKIKKKKNQKSRIYKNLFYRYLIGVSVNFQKFK